VRSSHQKVAGQVRPLGEKFNVDGVEMSKPGDPHAPIELWINCRCTVRPVLASESLTAAADIDNTTVVVALPREDSEVHSIGDEPKHVTLAYMGEGVEDVAAIHEVVAALAEKVGMEFSAAVGGRGTLGPDSANVWFVESEMFEAIRGLLQEDERTGEPLRAAQTHPHFVPHMTIDYGEDAPPEATDVSEITFDRLAVWHGSEQTEYPLGANMPDDETTETETEQAEPTTAADETRVPWHGILAPEGVTSGDGRRFALGSLTTRPLPLPLTWQKTSAEGHGGSVVVATIEKAEMVDGLMRGSGWFLSSVEANEVIGLIGEFGKFGVSVDADQSEYELNEADETVEFTSARVCGASIVPIPAFAEAWVALGYWDDADKTEPTDEPVDEALVASLAAMREKVSIFKDLAPGKTEDGPGWLTHPVDTDRLRDYWVRGEGAAKIGWGSPGDFNRCRLAVAEYVKPQYLNGYCANRHYDALGFWPGRPVAGDTEPFAYETMGLEDTDPADAVALVAGAVLKAPASWFTDPEFAEGDGRMVQAKDGTWGCPLTIEDTGEVYGHVAKWGTCHIGYGKFCQTAPHSGSGYAMFLTGQVALDDGKYAATGSLTVGGGHAGGRLGIRAAVEHYDSASAAVCDVTVGEDAYGIWFHGWTRPGVSDEMVTALLASPLSGDWRESGTDMEMIAAHAVNVPGFGVPRVKVAASEQGQISLVAAGALEPRRSEEREKAMDDPEFASRIAGEVVAIMERKQKMLALASQINGGA
jgi:2'-5' RNA ligase